MDENVAVIWGPETDQKGFIDKLDVEVDLTNTQTQQVITYGKRRWSAEVREDDLLHPILRAVMKRFWYKTHFIILTELNSDGGPN